MITITCECTTCTTNAKALGKDHLAATFTPTAKTPFNANRKADRHAIVYYANSNVTSHKIVASKFGFQAV